MTLTFGHCMREMTERKLKPSRKGGEADVAFLVLSETQTGAALLEDLDKAGIAIRVDDAVSSATHYFPADKQIALGGRGHDPFRLALGLMRTGFLALLTERRGVYPLVDALDRKAPESCGMPPEKAERLRKVLGAWPQRSTWTGFSPEDGVAHEMALAASSGMAMIALAMEQAEKGRMGPVVRLRNSRVAPQLAALMESGAVAKSGVVAWRRGASDACLRGFLARPGCVDEALARVHSAFMAHDEVRRAVARDHALLEMKNDGFLAPGPETFAAIGRLPGGLVLFEGGEARGIFSDVAAEARQKSAPLATDLKKIRQAMAQARPELEKILEKDGAGMTASAPHPHRGGEAEVSRKTTGRRGGDT